MLKHILKNKANLRVCCAVNDFASVNVDETTLTHSNNDKDDVETIATDTAVVAMSKYVSTFQLFAHPLQSGCICCSLMGDFRESISRIAGSDAAFDYVVVETSGVTDPHQLVSALDERFGKMFR